MYCLMSVSGYGVILLDEDSKIVWELRVSYPGERIYGLDYDLVNERILVGFRTRIEEYSWNKERTFEYLFQDNVNIHSVFYDGPDKFVVSCTFQDSVVCVYREGWIKTLWIADMAFIRPTDVNNWTHINYARPIDGYYYITMHNHPTDPNYDGLVLVLDEFEHIIRKIEKGISKPHAAIPMPDDGILVANAGDGRVGLFEVWGTRDSKYVWSYPIKDPQYDGLIPKNVEGAVPGSVKYSKGPHYLEYVMNNLIFMVIPNLRCARLVDWNKNTTDEWNLPKSIYGDAKIGEDPRPFQAKLLWDVPHGGL